MYICISAVNLENMVGLSIPFKLSRFVYIPAEHNALLFGICRLPPATEQSSGSPSMIPRSVSPLMYWMNLWGLLDIFCIRNL